MPTMLREKDDAESTSRLFSRIDPWVLKSSGPWQPQDSPLGTIPPTLLMLQPYTYMKLQKNLHNHNLKVKWQWLWKVRSHTIQNALATAQLNCQGSEMCTYLPVERDQCKKKKKHCRSQKIFLWGSTWSKLTKSVAPSHLPILLAPKNLRAQR